LVAGASPPARCSGGRGQVHVGAALGRARERGEAMGRERSSPRASWRGRRRPRKVAGDEFERRPAVSARVRVRFRGRGRARGRGEMRGKGSGRRRRAFIAAGGGGEHRGRRVHRVAGEQPPSCLEARGRRRFCKNPLGEKLGLGWAVGWATWAVFGLRPERERGKGHGLCPGKREERLSLSFFVSL
jgi:hypothetical protein